MVALAAQPPAGAPAPRRARGYTPPKIPRGAPDLSFFAFLNAMVRNPVSAVPETAYVEPWARSRVTGRAMAMVADPATLEQILIKRAADFPKSEIDDRVLRPAFGDGLLTAEGDDWRWKRRIVAPAFTPAALAGLAPAMAAPFERFGDVWAAVSTGEDGALVDVSEAMTEATLAVIAETLFDDPAELKSAEIAEAVEAYLAPISWVVALAALKAPRWLPHPGAGKIRRAVRRMRAAVADTVARRRAAPPRDDLFGRLMAAADPETGRPLSDEDLIDLVLTLIAAGHETSANTLAWALYLAAAQPAEQERLAAEAQTGGAESPRTERFLKETLRLFPVAPMMARRAAKAETFGDLDLPADATILIPIYAIHRHERLWERPDEFDPGRFEGPPPPRTQFMPFGAGPRVCVGASFAMQEMALGLAALLKRVRFEIARETECDPVQRVTLQPRGPLWLRVRPR